jgi:hypothetical protein
MHNSHFIKFDWILLTGISLYTWVIGLYAAQTWGNNDAYSKLTDYLSLFGLLIWAISPHIAMLITLLYFSKRTILIKTFSVLILIITLVSAYILFDGMFVHPDAQGGLIFLVLPMYQWAALFVFLIICGIVFRWVKKES